MPVRLVPTPVGLRERQTGKSLEGGPMPRPPRPKPSQIATPDGVTPLDARPEWSRAWKRSSSFVEVQNEWHLWECELCRQYLLVPVTLSKRALSTYLHDHRIHCDGNGPTEQDEST
jgi:hypothetical protein